MYYSRAELVDMGFKTLGENVFIDKRTPIDFPHKISLGNNIKIGSFCILSGDIVLKDNVRIASYVFLFLYFFILSFKFGNLASIHLARTSKKANR